ncbi:EAL domain-containing protein [Uliginosibacterium sp. 31-12]|uniref:EAL domain-containing protein n=1 Tax=Uliginosibacterium sp. 31-12 TaxID=3062781 RepID=UPI0026E4812F|nr:EAL domain-containing protein [Uliginosibacterium sp. 31-12]MDO6385126.1 EAL domain-containing protein [Uliginosibacterium sp. 31-12]
MDDTLKILLVDSEAGLHEAVSAALQRGGLRFTLQRVATPQALPDLLRAGPVDCLLCCMRPAGAFPADALPAGLRLLEEWLTLPELPAVIMLCEPDDEQEGAGGGKGAYALRSLWLGAADYVLSDNLALLPRRVRSAVLHQRALAEARLHDAEYALALQILRGSSDAICVTDAEAQIVLVNDVFSQLTGYSYDAVRGRNPRMFQSGEHDAGFYAEMWRAIEEEGCWQGEVTNRKQDGETYREWLRISSVRNDAGEITHYVGQFGYVAAQRQLVERIHHLSQFDPLTGLPSRGLFLDRLEQALVTAKRSQRCVAVMLINLDRFRSINDALGQALGDQVLIDMAQRFSSQIRQGDTVARLSGNEFCFLLGELADPELALHLASRLQSLITRPVECAGHSVIVSASIGISVSPRDGLNSDELIKAADVALMRAKHEGGNCFSFHSHGMDEDARRRQLIEACLREALGKGEFELVYQPQNSLDSGNIIGCEALLRWYSPQLGMVSPGEFIPVAEDTGLIIPIGSWVLREACERNKAWLDLGLQPQRVAVNLSARQFRGDSLVEEVRNVLVDTGLAAEFLELEITESALIHDLDAAISTCRKLKALGVKLSLDDFGTGYSSLAYIARFPFDKLKIDQGFVRDITHNPANAAIATAAIAIAHGLNLAVLAEGVETEAQALFLRSRRCHAMQGYLFHRPLAADDYARLLASRERLHLGEVQAQGNQYLLIVDDEPSILSALTRLFRHESFRVLTAASCNEAFEQLARHPAHVILSDQRMAGMTGTEFFARVRQLYPDTVRIILSGYTELESVMDAINRGAVYKFLTKPWEDDPLREQIREAFRIAASKEPS